ncbi:MAG: DUF4062 domain-containing protein, partial [Candidatus Lokiarchaeota archaeon]|nr:DUF4062 domain-containing protein [Candidatus Lokiarchaeota archaeon]
MPFFQTDIFRVFISSTFTDFVVERNALQNRVFPELSKRCKQHGCQFQAVDLRWGISTEASLDHKTPIICREEIERCHSISPRPFFISLIGDRHGWVPLPPVIKASEFEEILSKLPKDKSGIEKRELLHSWYLKDKNALPEEYYLKPLERADIGGTQKAREVYDEIFREWNLIEKRIKEIFTSIIPKTQLSDRQKFKYFSSITEQELVCWAGKFKEDLECSLVFMRDIEGIDNIDTLTELNMIKNFFNTTESGIDRYSQRKQSEFKQTIEKIIPKKNCFRYSVNFDEQEGLQFTEEYINNFVTEITERLWKLIENEILENQKDEQLNSEDINHKIFAKDRSRNFIGREKYLKIIDNYLDNKAKCPLVLYGKGGTGKSTLIAKAMQESVLKYKQSNIVLRHLGITPESSNINSLIEGLYEKISNMYDIKTESFINSKELYSEFQRILKLIPDKKPLILFIDSLDQLSELSRSENMSWLPFKLPGNLHIVVTTRPDPPFGIVKKNLSDNFLIQLEPLSKSHGKELLGSWLKESGRKLTKEQEQTVLSNFEEAGGLPLYLKLAFEQVKNYNHNNQVQLSITIHGIISDLFKRLSAESNHGTVLVDKTLSYIVAARYGLTEEELIGILSLDDEMWDDFSQDNYWEIDSEKDRLGRTLPFILWSRLYLDLAPYFSERKANNTIIFSFFHKEFEDVILNQYVSKNRVKYHKTISEYFSLKSGQLTYEDTGSSQFNYRKLSELPYNLIHSESWDAVKHLLTDLSFISVKLQANMITELLQDYEIGLIKMKKAEVKCKDLVAFNQFLKNRMYVLKQYKDLLISEALNQPEKSVIQNTALEYIRNYEKKEGKKYSWIEKINKGKSFQGLISTLTGHTRKIIDVCELNNNKLCSISEDETLRIWDYFTGIEVDSKNICKKPKFAKFYDQNKRCICIGEPKDPVKWNEKRLGLRIYELDPWKEHYIE